MFKYLDYINEDSSTPNAYPIVKNVVISTVNSVVAQKIIYRFRVKNGKIVGYVFSSDSTNRLQVSFGVVGAKENKILEKAVIDKYEMKIFMATQTLIFNRLIKEHPNFNGFLY